MSIHLKEQGLSVAALVINGVYKEVAKEFTPSEIVSYTPPSRDRNYWEFTLKGNQTILATGNVTFIVKKIEEVKENKGRPGKWIIEW